MTKKTLTQIAKDLKSKMNTRQSRGSNATISDLKLLLTCNETKEWTPMFTTKLYNKHGGEYCEYLSLLAR